METFVYLHALIGEEQVHRLLTGGRSSKNTEQSHFKPTGTAWLVFCDHPFLIHNCLDRRARRKPVEHAIYALLINPIVPEGPRRCRKPQKWGRPQSLSRQAVESLEGALRRHAAARLPRAPPPSHVRSRSINGG